ncbi:hypothetical protein MHYP_G00151140 [Metynnis hypsauchen]
MMWITSITHARGNRTRDERVKERRTDCMCGENECVLKEDCRQRGRKTLSSPFEKWRTVWGRKKRKERKREEEGRKEAARFSVAEFLN